MNYMKELNEFRDWVLLSRPSTGEVALWHTLMSLANMAAWPNEFNVPSQTLQLMTGLSRQGLDRARNQLAARGRITYQGGSGSKSGVYSIISFECQKVGTNRGEVESPTGHKPGTNRAINGHKPDTNRVSSISVFKQDETRQDKTNSDDDDDAREAENMQHDVVYADPTLPPDLYDQLESAIAPKYLHRTQLRPDEFAMLKDLIASGIEPPVIIAGINRGYELFAHAHPRERVASLKYFRRSIMDLHKSKAYQGEDIEHGSNQRNHRSLSGEGTKIRGRTAQRVEMPTTWSPPADLPMS